MILGQLLRHYRTVTKLPIDSVAQDIGISNATLSRIENNQREIDSRTIVKVLVWMMQDPTKDDPYAPKF